jgi:hypothetical protein
VLLGAQTPSKNLVKFDAHKRTSLSLLVGQWSRVEFYSAKKAILVTVVVTLGRR